MTYFTSLAPLWRCVLAALLFVSMISLLVLCIYKYRCRQNIKKCLAEITLFCLLLALLSYFSGTLNGTEIRYEIKIPYAFLILLSAGTLCLFAVGLRREYTNNKKSPTLLSLRQALDNLNSGVCFSDSTGRIILINRTMISLIADALGSSPQMLSDIDEALEGANSPVERIQQKPPLYRFSDGRVWSFDRVELAHAGLEGFLQMSAREVTEIFNMGEGLKAENKRLKETNDETQLMLERLADRIREQETLKLKTQIHNDIGTSLIEISNIIEGKHEGDMEKQLALLQNAVSYFSNEYSPENKEKRLEDAAEKAEKTGAVLVISGDEITGEKAQALAYSAACECINNAINHANGNKIFVCVKNDGGDCTIEITNNGKAPEGEIKEGGGLAALRRSVEAAGGTMRIYSSPEFKLQIRLNTK